MKEDTDLCVDGYLHIWVTLSKKWQATEGNTLGKERQVLEHYKEVAVCGNCGKILNPWKEVE